MGQMGAKLSPEGEIVLNFPQYSSCDLTEDQEKIILPLLKTFLGNILYEEVKMSDHAFKNLVVRLDTKLTRYIQFELICSNDI